MRNKGTKQKSKKKGSDNAFGCDLIEHLQNSGQDGKSLILLSLKSNTLLKVAIINLLTTSLTSYLIYTQRTTVGNVTLFVIS